MVERIEHEIIAEGFSKKEAAEKAKAMALELADTLDGDLSANPRRGSDVEITAPVKPSVEVERAELKFVNVFGAKFADNNASVLDEIEENVRAYKISEIQKIAKETAIATGRDIVITQEKVCEDGNDFATVKVDKGQIGSWKFTFVETIVADEAEAKDAETAATPA